MEPEEEFPIHAIAIPPIFHSVYEKGPFKRCTICSTDISQPGMHYLVEKIFHGSETIVELAICLPCRESLVRELSEQSLKLIQHHFEERVNMEQRHHELMQDFIGSVDPWIQRCLLTGTRRSECQQFQIVGQCDGPHLLFTHLPFMVSIEAMMELQSRLSQKTRERLEDFTRQVTGPPADARDLPVWI